LFAEPQWLSGKNPITRGRAPLELLSGPERIETGWWDGREVTRDYFVARDERGVRLWIYRDRRAPHGWYLHGLFG
jgi:protein ImuB